MIGGVTIEEYDALQVAKLPIARLLFALLTQMVEQ